MMDTREQSGSVKIHNAAIAEIVSTAIEGIEGVSLSKKTGLGSVLNLFTSGISVKVQDNNEVAIDVKILVAYGRNIPSMARQVQDIVRNALHESTDITVKDVNVNVYGIERRKP